MSLDPPTYLSSLQNNIRARPIPWDGAVRAGTITEDQLSKIRAVDKVRKEQRKQTVEADLKGYRILFVGGENGQSILESAVKRADVVQYILVLLGDLLEGTHSMFLVALISCHADTLRLGIPSLSAALHEHSDPYKPFVPLLALSTNPEEPIPLLASTVLSSLIGASAAMSPKGTPAGDQALPKLYSYLSTLAKSSDGGLQDIAMLEYSTLLRGKKSRELFWEQKSETVQPLVDILKSAAGGPNPDNDSLYMSSSATVRSTPEGALGGGVGLQLLYHVLLVLWQLSFESATIGEGLDE